MNDARMEKMKSQVMSLMNEAERELYKAAKPTEHDFIRGRALGRAMECLDDAMSVMTVENDIIRGKVVTDGENQCGQPPSVV